MRITSLEIVNFRAITRLNLDNLEDTVVIAGPNGCGKSCIFDAIRLLKSAYGGYQPNEWQHWFGEFQINLNRSRDFLELLQKRSSPLTVEATISLSPSERQFLETNIEQILTQKIWQEITPEGKGAQRTLALDLRTKQPEVESRLANELPIFHHELNQLAFTGKITIEPNGNISATPSRILELVFSQYDPQNIGIIDYHGANRNYDREQVGGINLSIQSSENRLRQHALYNHVNKYKNLKTEMAEGFVRDLLAGAAGGNDDGDASLIDTLKELFSTFFPGKEFLGPQPTTDGRLLFPVKVGEEFVHDIDELSSGEKEVLYGYLRLRSAAPRNSVLLIDEPELHLNPRLISGLVAFYHRHLGRALDNQLWLITHSDTLIREAVGQNAFSTFHMQPPGHHTGQNQASRVQISRDVDRLVVELVGDLAAYRPGAKIVVFEGGGDTEFDIRMTSSLFADFPLLVNPISGGNKKRVSHLYDLLEEARMKGHLPARFYSITDSDGDFAERDDGTCRFVWDVYHIENYLLEPEFILRVLEELTATSDGLSKEQQVEEALRDCAAETIPSLVSHKLRSIVNRTLVGCIDLNFHPDRPDIGVALAEAVERSLRRADKKLFEELRAADLSAKEEELRNEARDWLTTPAWRKRLRGREILRRFVGRHAPISYEPFRDLIIARMRDAEFQPPGMKKVVEDILADKWEQ